MTTGVFNPLTDVKPAQIKGPQVVKAKKSKQSGLCPICGERVKLDGKTTDGRLIGTCGDAFSEKRWNSRY